MPVLNRAGVLGIFLRTAPSRELRVGTLVRDAGGAITFDIDEKYIGLGAKRPILSLAWKGATDELSINRLRSKKNKFTNGTILPPYFENLLPEGALLDLVEKEFGAHSTATMYSAGSVWTFPAQSSRERKREKNFR